VKGKILLVEENDENRYLVTFLLERNGYCVVPATDGPSAIKIAHQALPAAILLDIQLPGMDGYVVARTLRQSRSFFMTPIIAVSAYAMPGDRERAMVAGCTGYINKPIDPDAFVGQIEKIISQTVEVALP
jgi:CheY-like chemotaxis protein